MKKRNITPFYLLVPVALSFSLFYAVYYLFVDNKGMMLAGVLLLSLSIGLTATFIVERIWVAKLKPGLRKLWITELLVLALFILFYTYQKSAYYYTVSDDTKWFATFLTKDDRARKSHYSFPFNRELKIDSCQVIAISKKDIGAKREAVRPKGHNWRGYSWQCKEVTVQGRKIKLGIYCRPRIELTAMDYEKMKSLLLQQLVLN